MTTRRHDEVDHRVDWSRAYWGSADGEYWFCNGVDKTVWLVTKENTHDTATTTGSE